MNARIIIIGISSLFFLLIGIDKFYPFMEPSCSLMGNIPSTIWKALGLIELLAGILIWLPKYTKYISGFFTLFMLSFIIYHISQNTWDIGGALFMAVLLGLLTWNPSFLNSMKGN